MKKRRALADVKFETKSEILSGEPDTNITLPTELESLILSHIPHTRKHISNRVKALLNAPVVVVGGTYDSPEKLWAERVNFREWVTERLAGISKLPGMNIDRAVYIIRNYTDFRYGYRNYTDAHYGYAALKPDPTQNNPGDIPELDIYGE